MNAGRARQGSSAGRRASLRIKINGKNASIKAGPYVKSVTYEDPASGDSDTLDLELHNVGMKWLKKWAPEHGDDVEAGVVFRGFGGKGKFIKNFGTFSVDSVKYKGNPISLTMGAISQPATTGFTVTKKSFTWKNASVHAIASKIAKRYGCKLYYKAEEIKLKSIEQNDQTDSDFLKDVCDKYSLKLKVFNNKIIVYNPSVYEKKKAVATLTRSSFLGDDWSYDSELAGYYLACEVSYTDSKANKDYKVRVGVGASVSATASKNATKKARSKKNKKTKKKSSATSKTKTKNTSGKATRQTDTVRCLYVSEECSSVADAKKKAVAKLNEANRAIETLSGTISVNRKIFSCSTIRIKGMGIIDGKYFVKKSTIKIDPSSGSTQALDLYKIPQRYTDDNKKTKKTKKKSGSYSVGDVVNFKGGTHYVSSYKGAKGLTAKAGPAKISKINKGSAHPYHLIHTDGRSNVYGWVDSGTFS